MRFRDGEYELRDYENRSSRYKTFDQMKEGLAAFLESGKEEQLERVVKEATTSEQRETVKPEGIVSGG